MKKMKWIKEIKAIGWDLDGTLYPNNQKLNQEIEKHKKEELEKLAGKDAARQFSLWHKKLGSSTKVITKMGGDGLEFYAKLWDSLPLEKYIKRDESVVEMFEKLGNFPQMLISNSNRLDQIEQKLRLIGLESSQFEVIVSTIELGIVKPDPEPFEAAVARLTDKTGKAYKMGEVLYVGDKIRTDIIGAKKVGMRTCLVGKSSEKADMWLPKVTDLVERLGL